MRSFLISQQGDVWNVIRRSRITCSRLADVLCEPTTRASKNGPAGSERSEKSKYRKELLTERITNHMQDHYVSQPMLDGINREKSARVLYEAHQQVMVDTSVGFQLHPAMDWFGGSSDGLVEDDGGIEIKCPTDTVHMQYLIEKRAKPSFIPDEYLPQIVGNMICSGRQWWDFISFNPYFPGDLMLIRTRLYRETIESSITEIEERIAAFNAEIEYSLAELGLPPTQWILPTADGKMPTHIPEFGDYDSAKSFEQNCEFLDGAEVIP